jgi:Uma2 family endonuclease
MTPAVQPTPAPALMTAEEFAARYENQRVELVRGRVVEIPMASPKHGMVCARTSALLLNFVDAHGLGRVMTNDSLFVTERNPDSTRGTDVCFLSYTRLPKGPMPEGLLDVLPELVFEVRSPSDRWTKVVAKAMEYLEAGVLVVVILDPKSESATVYRPDEREKAIERDGTLTVHDVLPGFEVPVRKFFE